MPSFDSTEDLLSDLAERAGAMSMRRLKRDEILSRGRPLLVEAFRAMPRGPIPLDDVPVPTDFKSVAVDGAHVADVDRSEAYSVSVAFALCSKGTVRSSSSLASFRHVARLDDVSAGWMHMQEVMLAVEAALADPERLVLIDGSRMSTLIAIDQFYSAMAECSPGTLDRWRGSGEEPGVLIDAFEGGNWLEDYILLGNIVGNTKLVSSRKLPATLVKKGPIALPPEYLEAIESLDDKTIATVVLEAASERSPGEGMGPFMVTPVRSPFRVRKQESDGGGYPHRDAVNAALLSLVPKPEDPDLNGFAAYYVNPTPSHGSFSLEVNSRFHTSPVSTLLADGREGDRSNAAMRGLAAYFRRETPSTDVQEPYLTHVADRMAKRAVTSANDVYTHVMQSRFLEGDLGWTLSRPHRTSR